MAWLASAVVAKLQRRPDVLRLLVGLPQRLTPILRIGKSVGVFRGSDIRDVLSRTGEFEIGPLNRQKMLMGPFLLGLDDEPPNLQEKALIDEVLQTLRALRLPGILSRLRAQYELRLKAALRERVSSDGSAQLDLVADLAEPFVTELTIDFFGVTAPKGVDSQVIELRDEQLLAQWIRKVGSVIAMSSPAPMGLQQVAEDCAAELTTHLDRVIDERLAADLPKSLDQAMTVLDGLIIHYRTRNNGRSPDAATIRRLVAGLLMAGNAPIIKSLVNAVDQLLVRVDHLADEPDPRRRRPPIEAAALVKDDPQRLRHFLFEAMRFNPTFPFLARYCPRDEVVGEPSRRSTVVPAGASVIVPLIAAMFDRETVRRPESFAHNRPESEYLHFGFGAHRCLGEGIATDTLLVLLAGLLSLGQFPDSQRGQARYDGPAIHAYMVRIVP